MDDTPMTETETERYDLVVIGGGSGGVRAARLAAEGGLKVALVEQQHLGGTCVNVGCVPKKLYHYAAGFAQAFEEAHQYGWYGAGMGAQDARPRLDWDWLKQQRAREIARLRSRYGDNLLQAGVRLIQGRATVCDAQTVRVRPSTPEATRTPDLVLSTRRILIATGGRPFVPQVTGRDLAVTSDDMFDLPRFPRRLLVVGGGYIACEMASVFHGLGAEVTLLQRGARLLHGFDTEIAEHLTQLLRQQGLRIELDSRVDSIQPEGAAGTTPPDGTQPLARRVAWRDGQGRQHHTVADVVLYATGRWPNLPAALGLDGLGVDRDADGRIQVDAHYQSSCPGIYAVGDVCTARALTPVAIAQGAALADHLLGRDGAGPTPSAVKAADLRFVPTAVFTHPPVGSVGYSETQALEHHPALDVYHSAFTGLRQAFAPDPGKTLIKLLVDRASGRVVGLHMVGEDAAEIVQGFAVALNAGARKTDFDRTIGLHPTTAEEFVTLARPVRQYG